MKILMLTGLLLAFAIGGLAHAEGSGEDVECEDDPACLQQPSGEDGR